MDYEEHKRKNKRVPLLATGVVLLRLIGVITNIKLVRSQTIQIGERTDVATCSTMAPGRPAILHLLLFSSLRPELIRSPRRGRGRRSGTRPRPRPRWRVARRLRLRLWRWGTWGNGRVRNDSVCVGVSVDYVVVVVGGVVEEGGNGGVEVEIVAL